MSINIRLKHHLCPGDSLVLSAAIRSLHIQYPGQYSIDLDCTAKDELYQNNPDIKQNEIFWKDEEISYNAIRVCNQEPIHFMEGFVRDLSRIIERPLTLRVNKPIIVLSEEEKRWDGRIQEVAGQPIPYALIVSGGKNDFTAKHIGQTICQEVVDHFKGKIQFVQVGRKEGHRKLSGVIDQRDKTTIRELIRMAYHAKFAIGPSTLIQHICAALSKPYIAVLGGREPRAWTTYPTQIDIASHGCLPCCQKTACWRSRTVRLNDGDEKDNNLCSLPVLQSCGEWVPKCITMQGSEAIIKAVENLYYGGIC